MKRSLLLFLVTALVLTLLASCKSDGGSDNSGNGDQNQSSTSVEFYKEESPVGIVAADDSTPMNLLNSVYNSLIGWNTRPEIIGVDNTSFEHEVVIGECDREVSKKAYLHLSRMEAAEHYSSYVIYSDGKSVCVAYDHESAREVAVNLLLEKSFAYPTLTLEVGVYEQDSISILDYYEEKDAETIEEKWAALERKIGPEYGPTIVAAFKEYYTNYNHRKYNYNNSN